MGHRLNSYKNLCQSQDQAEDIGGATQWICTLAGTEPTRVSSIFEQICALPGMNNDDEL